MTRVYQRQSIRLQGYDYQKPGSYFVTICVQNRRCLFGEMTVGAGPCARPEIVLNDIGRMVQSVWNQMPEHYSGVDIDSFIVMPNHIHGIVTIKSSPGQPRGVAPTVALSLPQIVHRFKSFTTAQYRTGVTQNQWPSFNGSLWQRNYYERVIRNEKELFAMREYIQNNPQSWVLDPENRDAVIP